MLLFGILYCVAFLLLQNVLTYTQKKQTFHCQNNTIIAKCLMDHYNFIGY